jgi:catechol 2,3-dioxygenase-like lactoylglutathione lyase family enzyme
MTETDKPLGTLATARPVIVICTRDRARAAAFYRDTLGLKMTREDKLAAVFDIGGIELRISTVADFTPHEHTILGFKVTDVAGTVKRLGEKGVTFNIYKDFPQDELGILTVPGTTTRVAWLKDPDGNLLSVTDA